MTRASAATVDIAIKVRLDKEKRYGIFLLTGVMKLRVYMRRGGERELRLCRILSMEYCNYQALVFSKVPLHRACHVGREHRVFVDDQDGYK